MGLLKVDEASGDIKDAEKSSPIQSLLIPYILVMLMFMLGIMGSTPLITVRDGRKNGKNCRSASCHSNSGSIYGGESSWQYRCIINYGCDIHIRRYDHGKPVWHSGYDTL